MPTPPAEVLETPAVPGAKWLVQLDGDVVRLIMYRDTNQQREIITAGTDKLRVPIEEDDVLDIVNELRQLASELNTQYRTASALSKALGGTHVQLVPEGAGGGWR
jgi:hypothetical protein